jgi:hypothetical protein
VKIGKNCTWIPEGKVIPDSSMVMITEVKNVKEHTTELATEKK